MTATQGTLDTAARCFGSLISHQRGRDALRTLGLSGADAPSFVCALNETTVGEIAPFAPTVVLVIDVDRSRVSAVHVSGTTTHDEDDARTASTLIGGLVDLLRTTSPARVGLLGDVSMTCPDLAFA